MADVFSPHRDAVVRSLERRFGSRELAEDAVQDALAAALARGETPPNPKAWLHVVAHRRAIDMLRGVRETPHAEPPEIGSERDPLEVLAMREWVRSVLGALHKIPGRQRDALLLRSLEGRTYDEIGARLAVDPANAKQLVSRARRSLCLTVEAEAIDCAAVRRELQRSTRAPVLVRPHLRACRDCARYQADLRRAARRRRLGALLPAPLLARLAEIMQRSFEVATGTAAGRACAGVCVAAGALATFGPAPEVVRQVAQSPVATVTVTPTPTPPPERKKPRRKPKPAPTPVATAVAAATPVATWTPAPPTPTPDARTRARAIFAEYQVCKKSMNAPVACLDEAVERQRAIAAER